MTVLGRLREQRQIENPSYPLTSQALVDLFTRKVGSGVSVTETSALQIPAVKRAVDLIAGIAAGLPIKLYRDMAGVREELETPVLLREPYPDVSWFVFSELMVTDALLWGDSFHFKVRTEAGGPWDIAKLLRIPPSEVTVERDEATAGNPSGKRFRINNTAERFTPYEIMHIQAQGHDGLRGLGRVGVGAEALGVALAAEQTAANLFGDGLQFAGILSSDQQLNADQAKSIADSFREVLSWGGRGPKIPVLGRGTSFEKISMSADEAQFIPAREFQIREVANLFGVDLALLNDPNAVMNYGEAQKQNFIDFTLDPWLRRIEQAMSAHLTPRGQFFEYTRGAFLRADTHTRYQTHALAVQFGLKTQNECRALENDQPIDGGDVLLTPVNLGGAANGQVELGISDVGNANGTIVDPTATLVDKVNAVTALIRAGFDPESALAALGLPPIKHLSLLPITLQREEMFEAEADVAIAEAEGDSEPEEEPGRPGGRSQPITVNVTVPPSRTIRRVERDAEGRVSAVIEEDAG